MVFPQNPHPVVVGPEVDLQHVLIHLTQELSRRCKAQIPPMQNIPFTACNQLARMRGFVLKVRVIFNIQWAVSGSPEGAAGPYTI